MSRQPTTTRSCGAQPKSTSYWTTLRLHPLLLPRHHVGSPPPQKMASQRLSESRHCLSSFFGSDLLELRLKNGGLVCDAGESAYYSLVPGLSC